MKQRSKSVGAGNPHATFCGNRGRATASGDPGGRRAIDASTRPSLLSHSCPDNVHLDEAQQPNNLRPLVQGLSQGGLSEARAIAFVEPRRLSLPLPSWDLFFCRCARPSAGPLLAHRAAEASRPPSSNPDQPIC